jgi:ABC-2 type transport system ATP-binding protein
MGNDIVVAARALSKHAGSRPILRQVDCEVRRGQVVGLLGKNGAGKSTLLDLLLGFALPSDGECEVFGEPSARLSAAAKARIGFVPQVDELIGLMTGAQLLSLLGSFHARWDRGLVARLAADWEVPLNRRIGSMSGGERQKLSTLAALGHHPELLVLDEPASSLDPVARRHFMQAVVGIAGEGRTILYSSHIVGDIERVATHVWILREGRIVWRGELDALKEGVVRLHLQAERDLRPPLGLPGQLACRIEGRMATATVMDWDPARRRAATATDCSATASSWCCARRWPSCCPSCCWARRCGGCCPPGRRCRPPTWPWPSWRRA